MQHKLFHAHRVVFHWRQIFSEELLALILVLVVFVTPAAAATRFQERGLYMNSARPGDTTSYTMSFQYMSPQAVGSVEMLFCIDPIPYMPCVTPPGLNVSQAVLSEQSGETGFSILEKSVNKIVLTRPPVGPTASGVSSYKFDNIVNPTDISEAFSIRLKSHTSTDATGHQIDFGSIRGQVTQSIVIETQVPPMLIFCVAEQVEDNCTGTNQNYYTDMGTLGPDTTLTARSQMAVGTNATAGFVITANGTPLSAGTNVIDNLEIPTESRPGENQFGLNLVANSQPAVGDNPAGPFTNANPSSDYGSPDKYKYVPGDVVAQAPNVSLIRKFTVSYIVNSSEDLRPGVYTTTITFIASGRF